MTTAPQILITGATGAVGFEILRQLAEKGNLSNVSVLVRDTKKNRKKMTQFKGLKIHFGDITDLSATRNAVKKKDLIIHLAALIPTIEAKNIDLVNRVNIGGTDNIIKSMEQECPDAFLLFSSSVAIYGDRIKGPYIKVEDPPLGAEHDNYSKTKVAAEQLIRESKLRWSIFRLTAIMGIGNHKINPLMFEMPLETPMEFATVRDTARAFVHAIDHLSELEGQTFNLSGGEACRITFNDFLGRAFNLFGLGKLNFPKYAFAFQNFHCGYYDDANRLEEILKFRRDTTETYFQRFKKSVPQIQRIATLPFGWAVKRYLLSLSEPYKAYKKGEADKIKYFFGEL